jgi:hypothetical protein
VFLIVVFGGLRSLTAAGITAWGDRVYTVGVGGADF